MPTSWIDYGRGISGFRTLKMPITRRVLWRGGSGRVAKQPYRGKRGPQTSSKCSLLMTCKRLKQFMRFSALLTARAEPAKRGMLVVVGPQNVWNTIHQAGTTVPPPQSLSDPPNQSHIATLCHPLPWETHYQWTRLVEVIALEFRVHLISDLRQPRAI